MRMDSRVRNAEGREGLITGPPWLGLDVGRSTWRVSVRWDGMAGWQYEDDIDIKTLTEIPQS